jgi:hypothetical protein
MILYREHTRRPIPPGLLGWNSGGLIRTGIIRRVFARRLIAVPESAMGTRLPIFTIVK